MASVKFQVSARCKDGMPIVTPVMINAVCASGLLADIQAFAAAWLAALQPTLSSLITESRIAIEQSAPGGTGQPAPGSKNSDAALMDYQLTGTTDTLGISLPDFAPGGYLTTVPSTVDPANAFVLAFNNFMKATTSTCVVTDEAGRAISGFLGGKVATRKHRKQISRAKSAP